MAVLLRCAQRSALLLYYRKWPLCAGGPTEQVLAQFGKQATGVCWRSSTSCRCRCVLAQFDKLQVFVRGREARMHR